MKAGTSIAGSRSKGFTYLAALAALVTVGITAQIGVNLGSTESQREREIELLFRGQAYRDAIRRYYHAAIPHRFPRSLEELLKDPRFLYRRHLRRLYSDPMGGEWRLVLDSRGGIMGVASQSEHITFKRTDFPPGLEEFSGAERYKDWVFFYDPQALPPA